MAHVTRDKRHDKFQDSNALIQLSRQLQAAHAADLLATARHGASHPLGAPPKRQSTGEVPGVSPSKRQKLQHVAQESTVIRASRGKQVSKTDMASIPAVTPQQQVSSADQHTSMVDKGQPALNLRAKQAAAASKPNQKATTPHPHRYTEPTKHGSFADWYSAMCTDVFADELSALHTTQDSSHAQPSLILRCIKLHATIFGEQQQGILTQQGASQQTQGHIHVSCWL
ncbi:TPA: hypothetical protein ACH3X1_008767 [Trebouxia sp. C0004]